MRLGNIVIINRAPFEHLEINLENENILLLSGVNGAGKTTVLSYIVDAFYELAKKAFRNEFEKIQHKYYRISSDFFSINGSKPSFVYLRFLHDGNYADYIDFRAGSMEECSQENYDSLISLPDKIPYSQIEHSLKTEKNGKYWSLTNKETITELFDTCIFTYFPAYRYETPYYLNDPYKVRLNFNKDMGFAGYLTNPIEVASDLPDIANWIMDVVLDRQIYRGNALVLFAQLNTIISNILISKVGCQTCFGIGQRFSGASRIAIMEDNNAGRVVYPSLFTMSSGELALLCLFGEILKQSDRLRKTMTEVSGIVLVDEIDKHLHIKLQKEILPALIALFPNIQFIASSHSPFLGLGLAETSAISYRVIDLDNDGISCLPQNNELFKEVYDMMISENNRYASKFKELEEKMISGTKPLIITEGKTDWKHIKAAKEALQISDLDIELHEYEDTIGDTTLLQMLENYARINRTRIIIGVFDHDNLSKFKCDKRLWSQEYIAFQNNVYAFAIPLVNSEEYGEEISIEHYYKKEDLTKPDSNGRRLFLGWEFHDTGISKDSRLFTRCSEIDHKAKNNGIVDKKVYDVAADSEGKYSIALSKNDFAELILKRDDYAKDFDFSCFVKIFDVIRKIISENKICNPEQQE